MRERDFWRFLQELWMREGREDQVSAVADAGRPDTKKPRQYINGHSLLPKNYDKISDGTIKAMGELLLKKRVKPQTKQAILIILAHHGSDAALKALKTYNKDPDRGLKYFVRLAIDECMMWQD